MDRLVDSRCGVNSQELKGTDAEKANGKEAHENTVKAHHTNI